MFCSHSHGSDARWGRKGGAESELFSTGRDFLEEACIGKNSQLVTLGLLRPYCAQELHIPCFRR